MVKLIAGTKGSGKTKILIDMVNKVVREDKGSVICIESGNSLTYDVSHAVRLIDFKEYAIKPSLDTLFAFICGLHAQNFDITNIFIDGLNKLSRVNDPDEAMKFLDMLEVFGDRYNINFVVLFSVELNEENREKCAKYL